MASYIPLIIKNTKINNRELDECIKYFTVEYKLEHSVQEIGGNKVIIIQYRPDIFWQQDSYIFQKNIEKYDVIFILISTKNLIQLSNLFISDEFSGKYNLWDISASENASEIIENFNRGYIEPYELLELLNKGSYSVKNIVIRDDESRQVQININGTFLPRGLTKISDMKNFMNIINVFVRFFICEIF